MNTLLKVCVYKFKKVWILILLVEALLLKIVFNQITQLFTMPYIIKILIQRTKETRENSPQSLISYWRKK